MSRSNILSQRETDTLTGKALVGAMTKKDQMAVMEHLNALYFRFDELDDEDFFGTEGWRHFLLGED